MSDKKFIDSKLLDKYEVLTDSGWVDIKAIHKTIEYNIFILKTEDFILECADKHIVFDKDYNEIYVEKLNKGDYIYTENGLQKVLEIIKTENKENMYDLELDEKSNKRYYTNGILSHNTTYVRHLLKTIKDKSNKNNILYFPPTMVDAVTDPSFIDFISNWAYGTEGKNYLLIEDAEPLLESRDQSRNIGITNLLNMTDGLLNDILNLQIIATFNTDLKNIDTALLRPERLLGRKNFKNLDLNDAIKLAEKIGIDSTKIKNNMSLADIYSLKNKTSVLVHDIDTEIKIGF